MATKHPINASLLTSKCCTTKLSLGDLARLTWVAPMAGLVLIAGCSAILMRAAGRRLKCWPAALPSECATPPGAHPQILTRQLLRQLGHLSPLPERLQRLARESTCSPSRQSVAQGKASSSNENKMSDGGRGCASLGVKVWKSSQKGSAQRSAVRSIAWLDGSAILLKRFIIIFCSDPRFVVLGICDDIFIGKYLRQERSCAL